MKDFKNKVEYVGKLHVPITQIQQLPTFCHICLIHFFSSSFGGNFFFFNFYFILFFLLVGGELLYNIVVVFVIH